MIFIKNEYEIKGDTIFIKIVNRKKEVYYSKVSLCDLEKLLSFNVKWHLFYSKTTKSNYVSCSEYLGYIDGKPKYKTHYLHRFLLDANKNTYIDHINYDTLDNQRENLRVTTMSQNNKHRKGLNQNNSTGERNVSWSQSANVYLVQFQTEGKNVCYGRYKKDELDKAINLANKLRNELYKEYA